MAKITESEVSFATQVLAFCSAALTLIGILLTLHSGALSPTAPSSLPSEANAQLSSPPSTVPTPAAPEPIFQDPLSAALEPINSANNPSLPSSAQTNPMVSRNSPSEASVPAGNNGGGGEGESTPAPVNPVESTNNGQMEAGPADQNSNANSQAAYDLFETAAQAVLWQEDGANLSNSETIPQGAQVQVVGAWQNDSRYAEIWVLDSQGHKLRRGVTLWTVLIRPTGRSALVHTEDIFFNGRRIPDRTNPHKTIIPAYSHLNDGPRQVYWTTNGQPRPALSAFNANLRANRYPNNGLSGITRRTQIIVPRASQVNDMSHRRRQRFGN